MIDTSLDEVQAFMTTCVPGSCMPAQCWHKISAAGQVTWDELSNSKATILGANTGLSGHPAPHGHGSCFPTHVAHAAQVHNLDPDTLAAFMHDIQVDDAPNSLVPPTDDDDGATPAETHVTFDDDAAASTELLAHATKHTWMKPKADTLPPSDLWKMMVDHPTAGANLFDQFSNYVKHMGVHEIVLSSDLEPDLNFFDALFFEAPSSNVSHIMDHCVYDANCHHLLANPTTDTPNPCVVMPSNIDYAALHPYFGWLPTSVVEKTFRATTQYAHSQ
jgi:hypothetical protein